MINSITVRPTNLLNLLSVTNVIRSFSISYVCYFLGGIHILCCYCLCHQSKFNLFCNEMVKWIISRSYANISSVKELNQLNSRLKRISQWHCTQCTVLSVYTAYGHYHCNLSKLMAFAAIQTICIRIVSLWECVHLGTCEDWNWNSN